MAGVPGDVGLPALLAVQRDTSQSGQCSGVVVGLGLIHGLGAAALGPQIGMPEVNSAAAGILLSSLAGRLNCGWACCYMADMHIYSGPGIMVDECASCFVVGRVR
jgi:hypothetical protein